MTKKNKEPSKPEGEATDFIEGMQRVEAVAVLDKVLGMLKDPQCEMSSIIHVVQKAMVKVESKEDNKAFGEQDDLWREVGMLIDTYSNPLPELNIRFHITRKPE